MKHNIYWDCEEGKNCYIEQVPNWAVFNDCFPGTNIKVSDMDGVVEHRGHILFFEVKQNTKKIQYGQQLLFKKLTENSNRITVILLYAQNVSKYMDIQEYAIFSEGKMTEDWTETTTEEIKQRVKDWFLRVRGQGKT